MSGEKKIELEYVNALTGQRSVFCGWFESIAEAVRSVVSSFSEDFNPANLDFEHVVIDGQDIGIEGLLAAEIALQDLYS